MPERSKLPWRDGDSEREYQPIDRQRLDNTRNVDADTVMNAAYNSVKLAIPRDGQAGRERRRGGGARRALRGPRVQYR